MREWTEEPVTDGDDGRPSLAPALICLRLTALEHPLDRADRIEPNIAAEPELRLEYSKHHAPNRRLGHKVGGPAAH
jgi:hypothetical protein